MPVAWRIVRTEYVIGAFSGEGARQYGGRWNSRDTRMVYTAGNAALAALETLVRVTKAELLLDYSLCSVQFDSSLVTMLDRSKLPEDWRTVPAPVALQAVGNRWIKSGESVALEVPSVVIETESNYLLNPEHPDFARLTFDTPVLFRFDPRLASA